MDIQNFDFHCVKKYAYNMNVRFYISTIPSSHFSIYSQMDLKYYFCNPILPINHSYYYFYTKFQNH